MFEAGIQPMKRFDHNPAASARRHVLMYVLMSLPYENQNHIYLYI